MRAGWWLVVLVALLAAACSSSDEAVSPVPQPVPGDLVVATESGTVALVAPDGSAVTTISDSPPGSTVWQPIWSPDGTSVAWSETTATASGMVIYREHRLERVEMVSLPFYFMWSPAGDRLAALRGAEGGGIELEIVDAAGPTSSVLAAGSPFYFSFSPDGGSLVTHVGATVVSVLGDSGAGPLAVSAGDFLAPAWTESGIVLPVDGTLSRVESPGDEPVAVASLSGPVSIVAGPRGERLAVQSLVPRDDEQVFAALQVVPRVSTNRVLVVDVATGDVEVALNRPAFAFFWSPDGVSLLILTASDQEGQLEWRVWNTSSGLGGPTIFVPNSTLVRDLVPFFDQYAQSWSPWAADSSAYAFAGRIDEVDGVWVQAVDGAEPHHVSDGIWVAWSSP